MKKVHKPAPPPPHDGQAFERQLSADKRASTLQVLFKVARLLDEEALRRVGQKQGAPRLRRAHTGLLPHIDLGGTRVTDLADRLGVSKQAVSQLVDDLEGWGVVTREADPDDARARRVVFTPRGRAGLLEGLAVLRTLEAELTRAIGAPAMQGLREGLLALHDRLSTE
ncbi:MAG TPA: MarR family transcriptional regulator [Polyangiales bacterium]